ncbi:MAG: 3-hydroxyacyl-CoA dehydrogenase family protein [Chlorobi bacterium]|nr:3-hydroxyacyl-CoA dehydrogenase family protein [Chlorobiota bacterium]MCI0715612.1 3-hydroxyacyl-CoA dehydrogenase family protein [Chlorobiota bacterium]
MTKIFVLGKNSINNELQKLLKDKAEFVNTLNNEADIIIDTENFPKEKKIENIKFIDERNSRPVPVFTSSLCVPVTELCKHSKSPGRLIGIGLYDSFSNAAMIEIAPAKITDEGTLKNAESFLNNTGLNHSIVPPRAGLVFPRVLSMLINEAAQVYSEQIASKEDIDTAMKLGTNYPYGPLEWADRIGIDLIYNILAALENETGESRYTPHPSIKEMAKSKKKFY